MSDQQAVEWRELHPHLAIAIVDELVNDRTQPEPPSDDEKDDPRYGIFDFPFKALVIVRVKSDSNIGRAAHNDLLGLIRGTRVPDEAQRDFDDTPNQRRDDTLGQLRKLIPDDAQFVLLRGNAEVPANPVRRTAALAVTNNPGLVLGFEYKDRS
jgi:hypothetical protein